MWANIQDNFDVSIISDKIINIDNTYDLISELFTEKIYTEKEHRIKYFIFSTFLLKNIQFPFEEIWRLYKVLLAINPNLKKEKTENNKYFGCCLKLCTKILHKTVMNLNLEKKFGFQCEDVSAIFDFLFSFPLLKHFINLIEIEEQKKEINEILNEAIKLIYDKINKAKNTVMKNVFNNFYHFLDIDEKNIVIPNNNKISAQIEYTNSNINKIKNKNNNERQNEKKFNCNNFGNINTINIKNIPKNSTSISSNNDLFNQLKDNNTRPSSKTKNNINKNNNNNSYLSEGNYKNKNTNNNTNLNNKKNNTNNNNALGKYVSLNNKKNINEEIKVFKKYLKGLINKVNSFINFEEMKKAIKAKLPGNYLMQIGSFLYMAPFPDLSNINIDLLISRQNSNYYIKKYFDTFESFKNIPNIKCSFFCLNKDLYFYECLDKNKSFFHLTRTDLNENEVLSVYPFKTVTVHLYAYNMIYGYSSFFIKKVYSTLKNVSKLHLFFERILLQEFPILKSNYEISILILNFLQNNYKIFSEKCEDKQFTYFAYDKSKNYGFLTNYPLVMQYKTLFFFEFDDAHLNEIRQKNVIELIKEFHKFICKYLEYILYDGNKFNFNRSDLNIFRENYFLDNKYIFNRIFLDRNLIQYKNADFDEFKKIQNLFNGLSFE